MPSKEQIEEARKYMIDYIEQCNDDMYLNVYSVSFHYAYDFGFYNQDPLDYHKYHDHDAPQWIRDIAYELLYGPDADWDKNICR